MVGIFTAALQYNRLALEHGDSHLHTANNALFSEIMERMK